MGAATQIAGKDLKLRIRDRSAIILGVIAPLFLAFIFNAIFGSAFADESFDLAYGVVDLDESQVSTGFTEVLETIEEDGLFNLDAYESAESAEQAVEDGEIDAFFLIPEGMGSSVIAGEEATVRVVGNVDAPNSTQIAAAIAEGFGERVGTAQLAVVTAAALSPTPPGPAEIGAWSQAAAMADPAFSVEPVAAANKQLDGTTYFAAGMAVFFVFFTVQFGVNGLLEEERDGTLARLLAAPIRRNSVVLGKALLSALLGLISMAILVVATHYLMGAVWGPPLGVAVLVIAVVLAAVSVMGLVAAGSKTPEGAGNLGSIIAVILGMFGGVFFQVTGGEDFLSNLSLITPHQWFLRGLADISDGASWTEALPATGAMLLFALVAGGIGWILMRRRLAK